MKNKGLGVALTILPALVLSAACGATKTSGGGSDADALKEKDKANTVVTSLIKGTEVLPSSQSRPATPGKRVFIISSGQNNPGVAEPVQAAQEAATLIGWKSSILDGRSNPGTWPGLVRQAVAEKANGIILAAIDCSAIKQPLKEALAAGVKVTAFYSFDCNETQDSEKGLYSAYTSSDGTKNMKDFFQDYGRKRAEVVISATGGRPNALFMLDTSYATSRNIAEGFKARMAECTTCTLSDTVEFKTAELGPKLQQKVSNALLRDSKVNVVVSPYSSATTLGISQAVQQSGRKDIYVMGNEALADEIDLIRKGQVGAAIFSSTAWWAWASVDALNSVFLGQPPVIGIPGLYLVTQSENLPSSGALKSHVDFEAAYLKAWGVKR